jgi:hypothetical protein
VALIGRPSRGGQALVDRGSVHGRAVLSGRVAGERSKSVIGQTRTTHSSRAGRALGGGSWIGPRPGSEKTESTKTGGLNEKEARPMPSQGTELQPTPGTSENQRKSAGGRRQRRASFRGSRKIQCSGCLRCHRGCHSLAWDNARRVHLCHDHTTPAARTCRGLTFSAADNGRVSCVRRLLPSMTTLPPCIAGRDSGRIL